MGNIELKDIQHLLGKPWELRGLGPDSFDCWGIVKWCLEKLNISVNPEVDYNFPSGIGEEFKKNSQIWTEIKKPENNCIVYGYSGGVICHIGFIINKFVLHAVGNESSKGYVALTKIANFKRLYSEVKYFKCQQ